MEKGKFMVLEGQGFTGKTEQAYLLVQALKALGLAVVETQEPGGVAGAEAIRTELLARRAAGTITPEQEVELFYKSRGIFLTNLVKPTLIEGKWIISTRFSASTFVYQGQEGEVDLNIIQKLEDKVVNGCQPDLYFLLDVPEEEIIRRMQSSQRIRHGYNELDMIKITGRRQSYLNLAKDNHYHNWVIINGEGSLEEVHQEIWQSLINKEIIRV